MRSAGLSKVTVPHSAVGPKLRIKVFRKDGVRRNDQDRENSPVEFNGRTSTRLVRGGFSPGHTVQLHAGNRFQQIQNLQMGEGAKRAVSEFDSRSADHAGDRRSTRDEGFEQD